MLWRQLEIIIHRILELLLGRSAAIAARDRISKQLKETATCLIFCSPRSVMDSNIK